MIDSCRGLILRETTYGDNDLIVNVLTVEHGKISVRCRGVRSLRSPYRNIIHPLFYNQFELYEKNGMYTLKEAGCLQSFYRIGMDIVRLALAQYILEAANAVSVEGLEQDSLLQLCLNTLYAVTEKELPCDLVKSAFELRAMCVCGFMPDISSCTVCGEERFPVFLDTVQGVLWCGDCLDRARQEERERRQKQEEGGVTVGDNLAEADDGESALPQNLRMLSPTVLRAMRYIVSCPPARIFSFSIPEDEQRQLSAVCEQYFLHQTDCRFQALAFYKSL